MLTNDPIDDDGVEDPGLDVFEEVPEGRCDVVVRRAEHGLLTIRLYRCDQSPKTSELMDASESVCLKRHLHRRRATRSWLLACARGAALRV